MRYQTTLVVLATATLGRPAGLGAPPRISFNATAGLFRRYSVRVSETDYSGEGTEKISGKSETTTPIQIEGLAASGSSASVQVTSGPLIVRGRSVGRSKRHTFSVDGTGSSAGSPIAWFSVTYPVGGAAIGQSWVAKFFGPAPMPAGLTAHYKLGKTNGEFSEVSLKTTFDGACHLDGTGKLYVRSQDGAVDHGSADFDISYRRPDPKLKGKFNVDSHVVLHCVITPS